MVERMPAPSLSSAAALAASAAPVTFSPDPSHAALAASSAKVFPVPAFPTTTWTPSPEQVSVRTIFCCSSESVERTDNDSTRPSSDASPIPEPRRSRADSSNVCSIASSSAVVERVSPPRPMVPSGTTWREPSRRSVIDSISANDAPSFMRSATAADYVPALENRFGCCEAV